MKEYTYHHGIPGVMWGIWNTSTKQFQFGICEETPMLAQARLFQKIGQDAKKWKFEVRQLPKCIYGKIRKDRSMAKTIRAFVGTPIADSEYEFEVEVDDDLTDTEAFNEVFSEALQYINIDWEYVE